MINDRLFYDTKNLEGRLDEFKKDLVDRSYSLYKDQKYKHENQNYGRREPCALTTSELLGKVQSVDDVKVVKEYKGKIYSADKFSVVFMSDWYFLWCEVLPKQEEYIISKYDLQVHDVYK